MSAPLSLAQIAARENSAMLAICVETPAPGSRSARNIAGQIGPYIGTGLTIAEVARRLDCNRQAVRDALQKVRGSL